MFSYNRWLAHVFFLKARRHIGNGCRCTVWTVSRCELVCSGQRAATTWAHVRDPRLHHCMSLSSRLSWWWLHQEHVKIRDCVSRRGEVWAPSSKIVLRSGRFSPLSRQTGPPPLI
jgi:hypothetical protein